MSNTSSPEREGTLALLIAAQQAVSAHDFGADQLYDRLADWARTVTDGDTATVQLADGRRTSSPMDSLAGPAHAFPGHERPNGDHAWLAGAGEGRAIRSLMGSNPDDDLEDPYATSFANHLPSPRRSTA